MGLGNFCILNHDFSPMRQIYGKNAIYRPFSSNIGFDGYDGEINTTYQPDIDEWFESLAVNVKYWLENDKVLRGKTWVRAYRNPDYVFGQFLQPLLTRKEEYVEQIQEAEILDSAAGILGAGADPGRIIESEALPGQDRPTSD